MRLAPGSFEEFDLDPDAAATTLRAVSVAGREYGGNSAGVVFGIMTTPTAEVPEGLRRVILLSDPTKGMGSLSGPECDRIAAAAFSGFEPLAWHLTQTAGGASPRTSPGTTVRPRLTPTASSLST